MLPTADVLANSLPAVTFTATYCAICGQHALDDELYPQRLNKRTFSSEVFSARRLPDRLHYRMVRCIGCGLVRSDPVADTAHLTDLYVQSTFDYGNEVANLRQTYGNYLRKLEHFRARKDSLLEIGCGNGFFLQEAERQGYRDVWGVEPSTEAVALADPGLAGRIVHDVMRDHLFEDGRFDVICLFQVFDHLPDPVSVLDECYRIMRPGGLILFLNHNVEALSARLLGERSPIVDVEHTYLYSPATMRRLIAGRGFSVEHVGIAHNVYSLRYLARLLPFPPRLKGSLLTALDEWSLGTRRLSIPLGNLWMVAQKPQ